LWPSAPRGAWRCLDAGKALGVISLNWDGSGTVTGLGGLEQ